MEETLCAVFKNLEAQLEAEDIDSLRDSFQELKWTMMCLLAIQRQEPRGTSAKQSGLYQLTPVDVNLMELNRCLNNV
jgi:hypothetical protein